MMDTEVAAAAAAAALVATQAAAAAAAVAVVVMDTMEVMAAVLAMAKTTERRRKLSQRGRSTNPSLPFLLSPCNRSRLFLPWHFSPPLPSGGA